MIRKEKPVTLTKRQQIVLAALACEPDAEFAPVQVQKLFFLIDENVSAHIGGKQFAFEPYDYGPFDPAVYSELEALSRAGFVVIENPHKRGERRYRLTHQGVLAGQQARATLHSSAKDYLKRAAAWVRGLSFAELVGAIYKAYPLMREKSIFNG